MSFVNNPTHLHYSGYITPKTRELKPGNNPLCKTPTRDPLLTRDRKGVRCKACLRRLKTVR